MTPVERDDFIHTLTTTMKFYSKDVDAMQMKFWFRALAQQPLERIKRAFEIHVQTGKYAPKPVDILGILDEERQRTAANQERAEKPYKPCPPEVADAWRWFLGQTMDDSDNFAGIFSREDIPAEQQEKYLHIVNHEAQQAGLPDAISDEYKLKEVWG